MSFFKLALLHRYSFVILAFFERKTGDITKTAKKHIV